MEVKSFGKLSTGEEIFKYTLRCGKTVAEVISLGATLTSLIPFGEVDVIGGYDTLEEYVNDKTDQGAVIGRVANRIEGAELMMDGALYMLTANQNGNCLHGGEGIKRKVWTVEEYDGVSILLSCYSPDGEDGFPSDLVIKVRYALEGDALVISYEGIPYGKTPICLTNHAHFNLDGIGGTVDGQEIVIYADRYTEVDEELIPNGERPEVAGTVYDLREFTKVGTHFSDKFLGYDRNFILNPTVYKEFGGVSVGLGGAVRNGNMLMNFYTDQPGVQLYTDNFVDEGQYLRGGVKRILHGALCLEAQTEPGCVKRGEAFYDIGETYRQTTVYEFLKL